MKKLGLFVLPLLLIFSFTVLMPKVLSSGMSPMTMLLISFGLIMLMMLFRPKHSDSKTAGTVAAEIMDDYCADAFAGDDTHKDKFYSALGDIGGNMPKSAVGKLEKLSQECTGKKEQYAIAMATAAAYRRQNNLRNAIREYNKALVINPTGNLAYTIGDAYQRNGDLDKARDSYDFAMELEPENPKYPSALGTALVGDGRFSEAIGYAEDALELDPAFSQALATMAICNGILGDTDNYDHYLKLAMDNGYKEDKITETIKILKKRFPNR